MKRGVLALALLLILIIQVSAQSERRFLPLQLDDVTARPGMLETGVFKTFDGKLYYLNKISREIKVYSLQDGECVKSIPLQLSGPNAVGPDPNTFEIVGEDSLLIHSDFYDSKLSLISELGNVKERLDLSNSSWVLPGMVATSYGGLEYQDGKIYAARVSYDYKMLGQVSPLVSLDINNKKVVEYSGPLMYSTDILNKTPTYTMFLAPSIFAGYDDRTIGVSFPLDHRVYISNNGFLDYEGVEVKSQYINEFDLLSTGIDRINRGDYTRQGRDASLRSGRYVGMFYEPINGRYFRLVRLPYPKERLDDYFSGALKRLPPEQFSVIVLDQSFQRMDEVLLPEGWYDPVKGAFIHGGELWILAPEGDKENEMKFRVLNYKLNNDEK